MSSMPPVTSGSTSGATDASQTPQKSRFTFEQFASWALPMAALALLLGALSMALRLGQMRWSNAGLAVYGVCLVMWAAANVRRGRQMASTPVGTQRPGSPVTQTQKAEPAGGSSRFPRFANWFFPALAIIVLTAANVEAAHRGEQNWLTAGLLSFVGCFLVWAIQLLWPLLESSQSTSTPPGLGGGTAPGWTNPSILVGLLLLSFLIISCAVWFARNTGAVLWLALAVVGFVGYLVIVIGRASRNLFQGQMGSGMVWVVTPAVAVGVLAAGVGLGVHLQRLNWVTGAMLGWGGCLAIWLLQIMRTMPSSDPSPDQVQALIPARSPTILLSALLLLLGFAAYRGEVSALKAALLAFVGGLTLWFSWMFVVSVERDGPPQIESNWGGLGNGMGGWRCSRSLVYALCALTFAVCTGFTFLEIQRPAVTQSAPANASAEKTVTANPSSAAERDGQKSASGPGESPAGSNKDQAPTGETK